jgi:hypothetical protein
MSWNQSVPMGRAMLLHDAEAQQEDCLSYGQDSARQQKSVPPVSEAFRFGEPGYPLRPTNGCGHKRIDQQQV